MPPRLGDVLELRVDRLAYGGQGVARDHDFVIFIRGALPGDLVRARVTKRKQRHAEARAVELLEASPLRVAAPCAHADACGGCEWQSLAYTAQLRFKQEQVVDALSHLGGLRPYASDDRGRDGTAPHSPQPQLVRTTPPAPGEGAESYALEPIRAMETPWGYRNKMEYSFGSHDGQLLLGLHRRGSWHEIVETDACKLAAPPIVRARQVVAEACRELGLEAYDRRERAGLLRHLVLRHGYASGDLVAHLFVSHRFPQEMALATRVAKEAGATTVAITVNESPADAAVGGPPILLHGPPYFRETLAGVPLRVPLTAFLQTNSRMCDALYQVALRFAAPTRGGHAWDLYCGIGSLTLPLARASASVHAVEVQAEAIAAAVENARLNDLLNVQFHVGDVRRVLKFPPAAPPPLIAIIDPPRAGLSRKALARTAALGAQRLVYVSCNPTTLAGNAAELTELGYRLTRVAPVDMFPHTHHIETVALFEALQQSPAGRVFE